MSQQDREPLDFEGGLHDARIGRVWWDGVDLYVEYFDADAANKKARPDTLVFRSASVSTGDPVSAAGRWVGDSGLTQDGRFRFLLDRRDELVISAAGAEWHEG